MVDFSQMSIPQADRKELRMVHTVIMVAQELDLFYVYRAILSPFIVYAIHNVPSESGAGDEKQVHTLLSPDLPAPCKQPVGTLGILQLVGGETLGIFRGRIAQIDGNTGRLTGAVLYETGIRLLPNGEYVKEYTKWS